MTLSPGSTRPVGGPRTHGAISPLRLPPPSTTGSGGGPRIKAADLSGSGGSGGSAGGTPVASIGHYDAVERRSGSTPGSLYITLPSPVTVATTIGYSLGGTAVAGTDYQAVSGTVTIAAGSNTATVTIYPIWDGVVDGTETVIATLSGGAGYTISPGQGSATLNITEVGFTATIALTYDAVETPSSGYPGGTGNPGDFVIDIGSTTPIPVTVNYSLSGTTVNGTDYRTLPDTATVPAGAETVEVFVQPIYHGETATTTTVVMTLGAGVAYLAAPPAAGGQATINIMKTFPRVTISGTYGKHSYDPAKTAIPWVMQGQGWSGTPALDGPAAGDFVSPAKTYTWTYPTGAVKGYGLFATFNSDPDGPFNTFAAEPPDQTVYPTDVKVDPFTSDDLTWNDASIQANDHVIDTFYWGPGSVSIPPATPNAPPTALRVNVTATFKSKIAGAPDFSGTDWVDVYVTQPTGLISLTRPYGIPSIAANTPSFGTPGVSASTPQYLGIDANSYSTPATTTPPVGISWTAKVNPTAAGIGTVPGQFAVTQTMTYNLTREASAGGVFYVDSGSLLPGRTDPGTILDSLHYPRGTVEDVGTDMAGNTNSINATDSPAVNLPTVPWTVTPPGTTTPIPATRVNVVRTDNFVMTLMYRPYQSGIWVPVGQLPWNWSATALRNGSTWYTGATSGAPGAYATTSAFPTWKHTFLEVAGKTWQSLT